MTTTAIKKAKPKSDGKPRILADGEGLYLPVTTAGKYWRYNYRYNGKQKTLAIGVYDTITLQVARQIHREARELLARGIDPSSYKQERQRQEIELTKNSFESIAREFYLKYKSTWQEHYASKMLRYPKSDRFS